MKTFPRKRPSDDDAIESRAAAWLAERDDRLSPDRQREFEAWCAADPRHAAAVARLEAAWSALLPLRDYRPTARVHPDPDILAPRRSARVLAWSRPLLLAAAAVVAIVAVWQWPHADAPTLLPSSETYSTTVGGYERVTLSDGSVLQLNDSSEIRVQYTDTERRLYLLRGQAHFTVAKNKSRPFVVSTPSVAVRAVGTAFDVRLGSNEVEVLVTEGTVQLDRAASPGSPDSSPSPLVNAGWRAVVAHESSIAPTFTQVDPAALREALSWQGPRLVFVETPLADVIAQFNRRNQIQISLGDPSLARLPVGGSFRAENVDAFIRLLTSSGDITADHQGDRVILHPAR